MTTVPDIFPRDPPAIPGRGWLAPACVNGETVRDVAADATLRVALATASEHRVLIDVEPLGARTSPMLLEALTNGEPALRFALRARSTISIAIRPAHARVAEIQLRVVDDGEAARGERGPRYRVSRVSVNVSPPDLGGYDFAPGPGWFLREERGGESFRWAGDEVVLVRTSAANALAMEIEPGPGVVDFPLKLAAFREDGFELAAFEVSARERIVIPLDSCSAEMRHVILRAARPGRPTIDDARVLHYRAFAPLG